jgi:nicotinate phosphoribosyltransferase
MPSIIQSLLDTDLYKFTMQQVVYHRFPIADVEYAFRCRTPGVDLRPYRDEIEREIEAFCALRLQDDEIEYLGTLPYMKSSYLSALRELRLNPSAIEITCDSEFRLKIKGNWYRTILFEVPVLAIINEVYFRSTHPFTPDVEAEGRRRLEEKCRLARESGLESLRIIEFGTRRRYSRAWQDEAVGMLGEQLGAHFLGTSNVALARKYGLKRYGTMAHEFLQAAQAFVALPDSQKYALEMWMQEYRGQLGIALSDVVGMDAFFRDFDRLFSQAYDGARHDSGDPLAWGEKLIAHYEALGLDPKLKQAVFTDSLDIPRAIEIAHHFGARVGTQFGIGTNLTNDVGFPALNIVIKLTRCNGRPVAKLSDTPGKTMGEDSAFMAYLRAAFTPGSP